jgi:hypothetical protein
LGKTLRKIPVVPWHKGSQLDCRGANGLSLTLDATSTGKAYFAVVPSSPTHPLKGLYQPDHRKKYQTGDRVTRIIPQTFGDDYRPIILKGATEVTPSP